MTGTTANSAPELRKIYRVQVVEIPTNRPQIRRRLPDRVFGTEQEKWSAVVEETMAMHELGRPVLIGTRSIDKSEHLSRLLTECGIEHDVLNARHLAREAEIVSTAGGQGRVTVATNMAGRGTDIRLDANAIALGGLHVIGTEMHESSRIDRQLFGRCGRQGEPGTYRQFMSFEDDLLAVAFGAKGVARLQAYRSLPPSSLERTDKIFRRAQRKIEARHFHDRKLLLYQEKSRQQTQREMGQDPHLDVAGAS
jgi:preprotein translocase subunit SecA